MKTMTVLLGSLTAVVVSATLAWGDSAPLSGRLVDAAGKPVGDAVVTIWPVRADGWFAAGPGGPAEPADKPDQTTRSASDGTFRFAKLSPGWTSRTPGWPAS